MPATLAGVIILLAECIDGFSDPVVGKLSDETRTKWGRRRPWMFIGSFPLCVFFWLLFFVPPLDVYGLFVYYLLICAVVKFSYASVVRTRVFLVFNSAYRMFLPGSAIHSANTRDYHGL